MSSPHRLAALSTFCCLVSMTASAMSHAEEIDVWIGTSSAKPSRGIYHCTLKTDVGKLSEASLAAEIRGPGFLAMHPKGHRLYAVGTLGGKPSVVAYKIVRENGNSKLELDSSAEIGDGGAAHVAVDPTGQTLLTAQYGSGSTAVFSLNDEGSIEQRTQLVKHEGGSGVVGGRQEAPHAHWVGFSPDNRWAFVPDLGMDQVVIYKFDANHSKIAPHGSGRVPPGGGPRHMKFHTNGKWIYVLNELSLSVSVFDFDTNEGTMHLKQTIETVPQDQLAKEKFKSASEIRVHPSGQYVYSANRGHDTITVFGVNPDNGELSVIEREHVRGATPRNFNLDPSGRWLLAAGQDSHTLACFDVDPATGELAYHRSIISVPAPICVLFEPDYR